MARNFATNQQISATTDIGKNQSNLSIAYWANRATSASNQGFGFNETSNDRTALSHFNDNNVYCTLANGSSSFGYFLQNVTGWNHLCMTFDGTQSGNANRLKGYFNANNQALTFSGTIPSTTSNNASNETLRIGRIQTSAAWSTGDFAEIAVWQATLTAAEVASLAKGFSPRKVRPQSLVYYSPLVRELQDVARGVALTNTDTTVSNHPRVYA